MGSKGTIPIAANKKLANRTFVRARRKRGAPVKEIQENAFAKLIPANTWECQICLVRNKNEQLKCGACTEPKPGTSGKDNEKDKTSNAQNGSPFVFGTSDSKATSIDKNGSLFTFNAGNNGSTTTGFTFGASTETSTTQTTSGFSFGASNPFTFNTEKSSEGAGTKTGSVWGEGTSGYAWGSSTSADSATNSSVFQFTTRHSLSKPSEPSPTKSDFKPEKEQKSGEEKDRLLYKVHCKVFTLKKVPIIKPTEVGDEKKDDAPPAMKDKYVESGSGDLHINVIEETGNTRARMVLRVDKTQHLVLNAPIFPEMLYSIQGDKYIRFTSRDLEDKAAIFLLKLRNKTETFEVKSYIEECIHLIMKEKKCKESRRGRRGKRGKRG